MSTDDHRRAIVVGVGNSLLSDEGVGCRVARKVASKVPSWVEVADAELPGPRLLDLIQEKDRAVIVDAVDAGRPPGTVYRFRAEQAISDGPVPDYSFHQGNILFYLKLAKAVGICPGEVIVVGVQPATLLPGESLSPAVEEAFGRVVDLVVAEACANPARDEEVLHGKEGGHQCQRIC